MQKLGQHFLKNDLVIKKIIAALALRAGDSVIEIGPGHGELTVPLLNACVAAGASLAVIEKDSQLTDSLRKKFMEGKEKIEIIQGDALTILAETIAKIQQDAAIKKLKLVGNLPYYITGKLLRVISELEAKQMPERCVFMVQREVAERIIATPPAMNRLAASVQFWADVKIIAHVPRTDFLPPPKIDSAVIALTLLIRTDLSLPETKFSTRTLIDSAQYYRVMHDIFAQPRKTLLNNLAAITNKKMPTKTPKEEIILQLEKLGIDPEVRPQNLSIEQIIAIAKRSVWG
jgi:16S rRNA (adenine1518-N6/adenine1519-N6)-dimethyltransferase